ncbi:hypothetical protein CA85_42950 [Allorhodopirellula solitaria]|uniref:Uncharacterized protein n=1 Tax=Allorhodopirellula solitaria TaxID=2527987 RepID=A0A5C5WZE4_9BACT|nr:hypothetical protein CA85_42950 [Allorhodopirellula solitaria]
MRRLAITICILAFLTSTYFLTSARWSGYFTAHIDLDVPPEAERDSFVYYECWNDNVAQWLCNNDHVGVHGFEPAFRSTSDSDFVSVSSGGTSNAFGIFDTYHAPTSLVLQYRQKTTDETRQFHRIPIPIPPGRGDRAITVDLTRADVKPLR